MNFGVDTEQIEALVTKLKANASQIKTIIGNIYTKIDNLNGNGWQGTGYDQFAKECGAYRAALDKVPEVINDFANFFEGKVTSNADTLHSEVQSGYNEIEQA